VAPGHVVVEDSPHDRHLRLIGLEAGRAVGGSGHAAVAVGGFPRDDLPGPGPPQLAPAVALGDLGPLVLGDDALHLGEQAGLGVVFEGGGIGEEHGHAMAGELVENDDLVGVDPGQTVRRQAPHRIEQAGFGGVAQSIEAGTVESGAGVAVVEELRHQLVSLRCDPLGEGGTLGADRAPGLLGLGRDPGVDGDSHRCASLVTASWAGDASSSS